MKNNTMAQPNMLATARQCAVGLLKEVLDHKRPFDEAVLRYNALQQLTDRDRNFARLLVLTCLRRLGQIDALLDQMLESPLKGKSNDVLHALRLGVVQLVWLETPPHAAVSAMVDTAAALGHERMKGLVNAVLKRVAKEGKDIIAAQDETKLNIPQWLFTSWREAYGDEVVRAIGEATLLEPPLDITVKNDPAGWAEKLGGTVLPTGSVRIPQAGRVDALPGYDEGQWWVQDMAAALPVLMLDDVHNKIVFDLCAAPGGKTAQLASKGAHVTAVDQSKRRLQILESNMARLKLQVNIVESDVLKWKPDVTPDMILLDAPCSATGTLRRHPEVVLHKTKEDVDELAVIQKKMLHRAAGWLKPGGKIVYCVCSLQPEESHLQIEKFLVNHPEFIVMLPKWYAQIENTLIIKNGAIRTHPGLFSPAGGMDGFYAICLLRLNNL